MSDVTLDNLAVRVENIEKALDKVCRDVRNGPKSKVYAIKEWNNAINYYVPLPEIYSNFELARKMLKKLIKERREKDTNFNPNSLTIVQYDFVWTVED